jgi:hypothetical protein
MKGFLFLAETQILLYLTTQTFHSKVNRGSLAGNNVTGTRNEVLAPTVSRLRLHRSILMTMVPRHRDP